MSSATVAHPSDTAHRSGPADMADTGDEMLTAEDKSFVRSTAVGVFVGVLGMFVFVAVAATLVAPGAGWPFVIGSATFASIVTGGFFGGVVFASRHLMVQEKAEALAKVRGDGKDYGRAA